MPYPMGNVREIELGRDPQTNEPTHTYSVVPQRHAYLQRQLGQALSDLGEVKANELTAGTGEGGPLLGQTTAQVWSLLQVFIPDLMPLYEWEGYSSEQAMANGDHDKDRDSSPDIDQMVEAFRAALEVNRIDLLRYLKDLVGPDFLKAQLQMRAGTFIAGLLDETSTPSENSPPANGASASTPSGTTAPTPAASSAASPSPASKPS